MGTLLREVTVDMLKAELTLPEQTELAAVVLPDSGDAEVAAWLQERVLQSCDRVVAAVNTCSRNLPIRTGLCRVPASCVRTALVLARHAVISAVPGLAETLEGGTRGAEYQTAVGELSALASCQLVPEYELAEGELEDGGGVGMTAVYGERLGDWLF